jgi:hypothetical protein
LIVVALRDAIDEATLPAVARLTVSYSFAVSASTVSPLNEVFNTSADEAMPAF